MRRNPQSVRIGLPALLLGFATLPFTLGQGCGGAGLLPVNPSGVQPGTETGNASPFFEFVAPDTDISAEVGALITIIWTDSDPDSNAAITLLADPDNVFGNGNERVILPLVLEDDPANTFVLDTTSLSRATYRIIARVDDSVNPELIAVAPGRLILFSAGQLPLNQSPRIVMSQPNENVALAQGETTQLAYCGSDADDGPDGIIPDVIILLDTDLDTTNDLDLVGPSREAILLEACNPGPFPRSVRGVLVLGCAKDNDCQAVANATQFPFTVDVGQVPPRPGGDPYFPRVSIWDHANTPVHAYSPGNLSITSLGSGTIDVGQVGRTISGARWLGFDAGGLAGSTGVSLGDFDNDGADDFIIVARFGRPNERGNVGSAFLVYGTPGRKFGNEIHLNGVGSRYRGAGFQMGAGFPIPLAGTDGIVSVSTIPDLTADGRPEILFGMPLVLGMYDYGDDDPGDDDSEQLCCYGDLLPNPRSTSEPDNDDMTHIDWRESTCPPNPQPGDPVFICSNDLDFGATTRIDQGYVIYVHSNNQMDGNFIDLPLVGMNEPDDILIANDEGTSFPGGAAPDGARFRGGWFDDFDFTQTVRPYSLITDNEFGRTVNSMPDMSNGDISPARDGVSELLISMPNGFRGRGGVHLIFGSFFAAFTDEHGVSSIPPFRAGPYPVNRTILGSAVGDRLGYASAAGDFNLDGNQDILMGAPGATRRGVTGSGVVYIIFGRLDFGDVDLSTINPPRVEIHGVNTLDQFGEQQTIVGDLNQDGLPDIGIASQFSDGPGGVDSGYIGVVFGGRRLTGENIFTVNQIGSPQLPGFSIRGTQPGGHAGAVINNAGDFNGDGTDDMLICAPDEIRAVDGQNRRGVGYVIFGGPHLVGGSFLLSQVGTEQLPGVVLVSPYAAGSADEAPIDWIGAAGDVNGDGFEDVLIGVSRADFVNPLEPNQRRIDAGEAYLLYGNNTGTNRLGG